MRSLHIARQMSSFTPTLPSGWVSNTSFCPCGFGFLYPLQSGGGGRGGRHMAGRSTKHVISAHRDGPWGRLLLWRDLLVSVQPWMALCAIAGPCGEQLGRATIKETFVDLRRQMGQYIKMGVWGSNKLVDLVAGTGTVNTASSRIWSTQMVQCGPTRLKYLNYCNTSTVWKAFRDLFWYVWSLQRCRKVAAGTVGSIFRQLAGCPIQWGEKIQSAEWVKSPNTQEWKNIFFDDIMMVYDL